MDITLKPSEAASLMDCTVRAIRKRIALYLQDFDSLEHFKAELIDYLYYYNNRRVKLKLKGLTPAQHRYQTLQVA